jgi:hypothetical protein
LDSGFLSWLVLDVMSIETEQALRLSVLSAVVDFLNVFLKTKRQGE